MTNLPPTGGVGIPPDSAEKHACADYARGLINGESNPMHGLRGQMVVSERPPAITVPEFPPQGMTCPHGVKYWTYPDGDRVAALRDLNYPSETLRPGGGT